MANQLWLFAMVGDYTADENGNFLFRRLQLYISKLTTGHHSRSLSIYNASFICCGQRRSLSVL